MSKYTKAIQRVNKYIKENPDEFWRNMSRTIEEAQLILRLRSERDEDLKREIEKEAQ